MHGPPRVESEAWDFSRLSETQQYQKGSGRCLACRVAAGIVLSLHGLFTKQGVTAQSSKRGGASSSRCHWADAHKHVVPAEDSFKGPDWLPAAAPEVFLGLLGTVRGMSSSTMPHKGGNGELELQAIWC